MARPFASFVELSAPLVGRRTGIDHDLQDRLTAMDARAIRIMRLARIETHTFNSRDVWRIGDVTGSIEKMPNERKRRTLLIPSQAYRIRRDMGDELRFYAEHYLKTPLCWGTFTGGPTPLWGDLSGDVFRLREKISTFRSWYKKSGYAGYGFDIELLANDFAINFDQLSGLSVNGHVNFFYSMKSPMPAEVWEGFCKFVRERFDLGFYISGPVGDLSTLFDYLTKLYKKERSRPDEILFSDIEDDAAAWFLSEVNKLRNLTPARSSGFAVFRSALDDEGEKIVRKRTLSARRRSFKDQNGETFDALVAPSRGECSLVIAKRLSSRILQGQDDSPFPPGYTEGPPRVHEQDQYINEPVHVNCHGHSDITLSREGAASSAAGRAESVEDQDVDDDVHVNSLDRSERGLIENLIIARERPAPTRAGIWETHTQVMNLTLTPETDDGAARLKMILDDHRQALGWARKNGWRGEPNGPLARLAAGEPVVPVVLSRPPDPPEPPSPHNPEDGGSFMHANSLDENETGMIVETSESSDCPPHPSYGYTPPTDAEVEAARAVLPVEQHGLPPAYLVLLARGRERAAANASLPVSARRPPRPKRRVARVDDDVRDGAPPRRPALVEAWEVSNGKTKWRAMRRIPGGWQVDRTGLVESIPPEALTAMPEGAVRVARSDDGRLFWITSSPPGR